MKTQVLLHHFIDGQRILGPHPGLTGDVSQIAGDCSKVHGDASGLSGDVSGLIGDCRDLQAEDPENDGPEKFTDAT